MIKARNNNPPDVMAGRRTVRKEGMVVNDAFRDPTRKNSGSCLCLFCKVFRRKLSQAPRQPRRHSSSTSSPSASPPPPSTASSSLPPCPVILAVFDLLRCSFLLAGSHRLRVFLSSASSYPYIRHTVTMAGFDFSNHNRNLALHARGVPLPKATSTGTTIVGCVYDGGVVVGHRCYLDNDK